MVSSKQQLEAVSNGNLFPNRPFRCIKILPETKDFNTRLQGINPTNSVVIPQSLVLRFIVLLWILIYRNWSHSFTFLINIRSLKKNGHKTVIETSMARVPCGKPLTRHLKQQTSPAWRRQPETWDFFRTSLRMYNTFWRDVVLKFRTWERGVSRRDENLSTSCLCFDPFGVLLC